MHDRDPDKLDLAAIAEAALDRIKQHGNRPSPRAFEVWSAYFTGNNAELAGDIDALISRKQRVTDQDLDAIYADHLFNLTAEHEIRETTSEVRAAVEEILGAVGQAGENVRGFGETLQGATVQLEDAKDAASLRGLVRELVASTRQVLQRNQVLEEQLSRSNQQISELRSHLMSTREDAQTDPLTGVGNRRFFETLLTELAAEASSTEKPLSLCMIDIDRFKQFNDNHGHQLGDQVLRLVGMVLRDNLKGRDVPARYGGEEFAILLPGTRLRDATLVANQLREFVGRKQLTKRSTGESVGTIGLSIGVSQYRFNEPIAEFISRADAALYLAKNSGRNRVCSETMLAGGVQTANPDNASEAQTL